MKLRVDCDTVKKWWQWRKHVWSGMEDVRTGPGGAISWRVRCSRCDYRKTVGMPG